RLQDGQVAWLGTLEYLADINTHLSVSLADASSIAHQTASLGELAYLQLAAVSSTATRAHAALSYRAGPLRDLARAHPRRGRRWPRRSISDCSRELRRTRHVSRDDVVQLARYTLVDFGRMLKLRGIADECFDTAGGEAQLHVRLCVAAVV